MFNRATGLVISLVATEIAISKISRMAKLLIFLGFFIQFILRKRTGIGESREGAEQVAIKVINLKTAQAAFVEKFLPRELNVARVLGLVKRFLEKK